MQARLLVVDDEPEMTDFLSRFFRRQGYEVQAAASGEEAWKAIEESVFDLVICDLAMEGLDGLELLRKVRTNDSVLPFIVVTGVGTIETAVEAIQLGAFHYITKPFNISNLEILAKRALEYGRLHKRIRTMELQEEVGEDPPMLIGSSKVMQELLRRIQKIADSQAPVLIQGETGTGKSLLAKIIHGQSSRGGKPFVTIDCGALTETLLESELFGHVKGAFTGAVSAKRGLLEEAQGGTAFLDEIGEVSLPTQVKLLRAIQEREIKPVGGIRVLNIDVRFVCATSQDLAIAVKKGTFREELYYRLAVVPVHLPPLRERLEDLNLFIDYFVKKFCRLYKKSITSIEPGVLQMFHSSLWKGNIRELANMIERGVLLAENATLSMDSVCGGSFALPQRDHGKTMKSVSLKSVVEDAEKNAILKTLKATNNNRSEAARLLGISRRALYDKLAVYGLNP
jgi:DNA-binding NtrC family response regulator